MLTLGGVLVAAIGLWWPPLFDNNLHPVISGEIYRSAQPSPEQLAELASARALRSAISLRGDNYPTYPDVAARAERSELRYDAIRLSGDRLPSPQKLRDLIRLIDSAPRPLLIHCRAGVERTGLASGIALLLEGQSIDVARRQLALRYGFLQIAAESDLPQLFDQYEDWLAVQRRENSPHAFRDFARAGYIPYFYRARIEPVEFPTRFEVGTAYRIPFRVRNESAQPWRFGETRDSGVHLDGVLWPRTDAPDARIEANATLPGQVVAPGEAVVLELGFPPIAKPGRHRFEVDLVDQKVTWFAQMGSEPFVLEVDVSARERR